LYNGDIHDAGMLSSKIFSQKWLPILIDGILLIVLIICGAYYQLFSQLWLQILIGGIGLDALILGNLRLMRYKLFSQQWLQILFWGLLLSALTMVVVRQTNNIYFVPATILLNAFVVPLASLSFLYQYIRDKDIQIQLLAVCFIVGGTFGLVAAGFFEYGLLKGSINQMAFEVGLIEESGKLIFPLLMFVSRRFSHEADGLLFGVASGMGFAALETMGYAMNSFIQSGGSLGATQQVLLIRGILSQPLHALWTGFICAILWRQRQWNGRWMKLAPIGAFILVVVLHASWNIIASDYTNILTLSQLAASYTLPRVALSAFEFLIVFGISLGLAIWRFQKSRNLAHNTIPGSN